MESLILNRKQKFYSIYLDEEIIDLLSKTFEIPDNYSCDIIEVTEPYVARPDLLANDILGDEDYGEIICKINGISNPYEMNTGMLLVVPNVVDMDEFTVFPSTKWKQSKSDTEASFDQSNESAGSSSYNTSPTSKQKTEKRKPNEAVVGDSRFNIDPVSKIVIY